MPDNIKNIQNQSSLALNQQKLKQAKSNFEKSGKDPEALKKAANEFESLFIHQLLKEMRKTVMKSELLGEGYGGEIMQGMFDDQLSRNIAGNSNFGLAEMLVRQYGETEQIEVNVPNLNLIKRETAIPLNSLKEKVAPFDNEVKQAADRIKLNPHLIQAVILAESDGNPDAVSSKGAKGLMQLIDSTAAEMGVSDSFNPGENVNGGAAYLKKMLDWFDNDLNKALAAYNAGPGAVQKYNGVPPYKETQNYIKKIRSYFRTLAAGSGNTR